MAKKRYMSASEEWLRGVHWDEEKRAYVPDHQGDGAPVSNRFVLGAAILAVIGIIAIIVVAGLVRR
jgi:hypothetical protein